MSTPPALRDLSDQDVVALALKGDELAHRELSDRYRDRVHTLLNHMVEDYHLAEDLTQVTFSKVSQELHSYRPEHKFETWLFAVATNVGLDDRRKKQIDTLTLDTTGPITSPSGNIRGIQVASEADSTPIPVRLARRLGPELNEAIERLRPEYRECVRLRFVERQSYADIARITNLPMGTVGTRLMRALEELRETLGPLPDLSASDTPRPPA